MSSTNTHRKQYQRITYAVHFILIQKRLRLIELVIEKKYSICRAAVVTGIALSTAKIIVKRFRKEGTVFVRREERNMLKKREEKS